MFRTTADTDLASTAIQALARKRLIAEREEETSDPQRGIGRLASRGRIARSSLSEVLDSVQVSATDLARRYDRIVLEGAIADMSARSGSVD